MVAKLVAHRLALGLIILSMTLIIIFFSVDALPGDAASAILGPMATPETLKALRNQLGLDVPSYIRFFHWAAALAHGDLGTSIATNTPVSEVVSSRMSNTLLLAFYAALISVPAAIVLGLTSALYKETLYDRLVSVVTVSAISLPTFFVGYVLVALFAVHYSLFPAISTISESDTFTDRVSAMTLPAVTLAFSVTAHMMRLIRAAILDVMSNPYIEMATLKGVSKARCIWRHALPNAMAPIINVIIVNLAYLIVGVVVVETIFVYPGLGQFLVDSVTRRDIPVVQASCLVFAAVYILLNLAADVLSILFNPRLRYPQ
jgi:peptide/nickel transport system permease protein